MPEKSRPLIPVREHDTGLHDVMFSFARSRGSHAAEMISVKSQGRREDRDTTV